MKPVQTSFYPNRTIPTSKILKKKYGCDGFEEMNNFLHRNFFIFETYFELKFWEFKVCF
jgi:hypothetical protein